MDVGHIPFSKILQYADYYGFTRRRTEMLIYYITELDNAYLNWLQKRRDKKPKKE